MSPRTCLALLLLVGCEHGQTPIETALVAPVRTPCQGFGPQLCLTLLPDQQPQERLFDGIQGFTHRWGIESEITFRREQVEPVPDGPSELIIMLELVVENQIITAPFELDFPSGGGWFTGSTSPLQMFDTTVECEATVCSQLLSASGNGFNFTVMMELTDDDQTLRALSVL